MAMGLDNPFLDLLVETCGSEHEHDCVEGADYLVEGVEDGCIVLPAVENGLVTEALSKGGLDKAMQQLRKTYGSRWVENGRTRPQLMNMVRQQKFLNHHEHLDKLLRGGVRPDGSAFAPGGGIRWGGLMAKDGEILMRTMGSFEYGNQQDIYQQTLTFANYKNIMRAKNLTWQDKARLLMRDRVKVHCDCPAFRYYYAHTAHKKGFGLYPELRPAEVRNPKNKGGICKHLHMVLQWLGTHNAALARELKQHAMANPGKRGSK